MVMRLIVGAAILILIALGTIEAQASGLCEPCGGQVGFQCDTNLKCDTEAYVFNKETKSVRQGPQVASGHGYCRPKGKSFRFCAGVDWEERRTASKTGVFEHPVAGRCGKLITEIARNTLVVVMAYKDTCLAPNKIQTERTMVNVKVGEDVIDGWVPSSALKK
jgi:hypothetical protein